LAPVLMMKSTRPRSKSSMTAPPSPAGVIAPAIVSAIVVSWSGDSILSEKMRQASPSRAALKAWKPSSMSVRTSALPRGR
jgi:hypothetical protein